MSEAVEGHDTKPEGEQEQKTVNVDEVLGRLETLEKSNKRLLDESKTWKSKYQSVKSEVEEREHTQLRESNDFKGLYEKTLEQVSTLKDELKGVKMNSLETSLQYEVAKHAQDARDVDLLLNAVKTKKQGLLGYDKEANQWKGVDIAIDELRTDRNTDFLFKRDTPGHEDGRANAIVPKEKTIDEIIDEDPMAALRSVIGDVL